MGKSTVSIGLTVRIVGLTANSYIAMTQLGGFNLRGQRRGTPLEAAQSLFAGLGAVANGIGTEDASLALDLALEGSDLETILQIEAATTEED